MKGQSEQPLRPGEWHFLRQVLLTSRLKEAMGGSLPLQEELDFSNMQQVLDAACGAGGWALDLAQSYPHLQVTGIDISAAPIAYAQRLAREGNLTNAQFLVQDMRDLRTDLVPVKTFDLVHLSFIASALLTVDYADLVRRLFQFCRPGGMICWTEMEFPITTSASFEQLITLTCQALQQAGHTFLPPTMLEFMAVYNNYRRYKGMPELHEQRRHLGITPLMGRWLHDAGYQHIQHTPVAIEVSAQTDMHLHFVDQVEIYFRQVQPFLVSQGVITQEASETLLANVYAEIQQDNFCGICYLLAVSAQKPV